MAGDPAALVLDGGLGTRLEARGNDVTTALWSAEILRLDPAEVRAAHVDFFRAGARAATTCSYQVSHDGYARVGVDADAVDELLRRSVAVAREARTEAGLGPGEARILASVGPYGAALGDGSEYTGAYGLSVDALRDWHRRRLRVLAGERPDALLAETLPSLAEVRAIVAETAGLDTPVIVSATVGDDGELRSGESIARAAEIVDAAPHVAAIGVNCSSVAGTTRALRRLHAATAKPLVAYPNSGEVWDAVARGWSGSAAGVADAVPEWLALGAVAIGGCCRVDTAELARIAAAVSAGADPERA